MAVVGRTQLLLARALQRTTCSLSQTRLQTTDFYHQLPMKELTSHLLSMPKDDVRELYRDQSLRKSIVDKYSKLTAHDDQKELNQVLSLVYNDKFQKRSITDVSKSLTSADFILNDVCFLLDDHFSNYTDSLIEKRMSELLPKMPTKSGKEYIKWLMQIIHTHPSSTHPYYNKFMTSESTREDLQYWLAQESTLDQRFDDILAYMQIGTDGAVKMEVAQNYWDEMGNGKLEKTHTVLFKTLCDELNVSKEYINENLMFSSTMIGNISSQMVLNKSMYYQSLGYYGVTEFMAPKRFRAVVKALERNGVSKEGQEYHKLHVWIDTVHGAAWFNNIVRELVEQQPEAAGKEILKGALIRLETSLVHLKEIYETTPSRRNEQQKQQVSA